MAFQFTPPVGRAGLSQPGRKFNGLRALRAFVVRLFSALEKGPGQPANLRQRFRNGKFFGWRTLWQGCFSALVVCRVEFSVKNILPTMFFVAQNH